MTQLALFEALPDATKSKWQRIPVLATGKAHYEHDSGAMVLWCGHPTALHPYYVRLPDGSDLDIYDRGGLSCFRTVVEAKAAAEERVSC